MTDAVKPSLSDSQQRAQQALVIATAAASGLICFVSIALSAIPVAAISLSLGFAAVAIVGGRRPGPVGRIVAALGLVGQPVALTAALTGHPWQIDSHMTYFAALAMLVALYDVRALLLAAGAIALHHLSFSVLMPALVFPGGSLADNIQRSIFHGAVVLIETLALAATIRERHRIGHRRAETMEAMEASLAKERSARAEVDAALARAAEQTRKAETAAGIAESARRSAAENAERAIVAEQAARDAMARNRETSERALADQRAAIEAIVPCLRRLAEGDLTARIDSELPEGFEALRRDFNRATERLGATVAALASHADDLRQQSSALNTVSGDLSIRSQDQAEVLTRSKVDLDALTGSVRQAAEKISETADLMRNAQSSAQVGGDIARQAISAMMRIEQSSGQVSRIVTVIEDIAFQTNLLALNAGVEAARAGEAGRGFAVVASEVRSLAQRSSNSAREITALIETSGNEVRAGVDLVRRAAETLAGLVGSITMVTDRMEQVAAAAADQSASVGKISGGVGRMEGTLQQTAAHSQEAAAAVGMLVAITEDLAAIAGGFTWSGAPASSANIHPAPGRSAA